MFNALNRFIARLDGDGTPAGRDSAVHSGFGFQVLRNTNLALAAIEPWFDFVVGINGRPIDDSDPALFAQEVRNCAGGTVTLGLWSAKGQRARTLHVAVPADTASLGLALQWTPLAVVSNIWHVLDVPARSPAEVGGLLPYSDYVLGTPEGVLHGESGLGELVEDHIGRPLRLWVYNNEYDVTREVTIHPSRDWGGEGALGCVLGYGALHRLPAPLHEPVSGPGETMFDGGATPTASTATSTSTPVFSGPPADNLVLPSQLVAAPTISTISTISDLAPPPLGGAPSSVRPKKKSHAKTAGLNMDDYFKEEEQRSQQLEGSNTTSRVATPVPPPPKAVPKDE